MSLASTRSTTTAEASVHESILSFGNAFLEDLHRQHQDQLDAAVSEAIALTRERAIQEREAAVDKVVSQYQRDIKLLCNEHAAAIEEAKVAQRVAFQDVLEQELQQARQDERAAADERLQQAKQEALAAKQHAVRTAALKARASVWTEAEAYKEQAVLEAVTLREQELTQQHQRELVAARRRSTSRVNEAAIEHLAEMTRLQETIQRLQDQLEEAQQATRDEQARHATTQQELKTLMEDYRRTLTILPNYDGNNNWLL
eukprot:TRINITY_DN12223_c0_g1_i3.p2 TRINITY_DN12223_c0_g1~~TRINITY_DN12223_c0_g1_i3.p2  ORF type:complete len:258 (+),score=70.32 TRINITY_DN12223_c0_g1_i3:163-936(+)